MNARVIAATNRDLQHEIESGAFRADLFHRLDVLTLRVPPLRDRPEDIPVLVAEFLKQFHPESPVEVRRVSRQAMKELQRFDWPGNIRQLRNVIHRACVVADSDTIEQIDLPKPSDTVRSHDGLPDFTSLSLKEVERHVILERIERCQGNRSEAAAELGITTRTLRNKMALYRRDRKAA